MVIDFGFCREMFAAIGADFVRTHSQHSIAIYRLYICNSAFQQHYSNFRNNKNKVFVLYVPEHPVYSKVPHNLFLSLHFLLLASPKLFEKMSQSFLGSVCVFWVCYIFP